MMGTSFPNIGNGSIFKSYGTNLAGTDIGTTITANASANTKGSWTELVASTEFDSDTIIVTLTQTAGTTDDFLIDIGIGASTSEKVLIPNILQTNDLATNNGFQFCVSVPKGSRISARCQSTSGSTTLRAGISLKSSNLLGFCGSRVIDIGTNTADSGGTGVDPGGTADTLSGWVQMSASTDADIHQLVTSVGSQGNTQMSNAKFIYQIGIGASTFEKPLTPYIYFTTTVAELILQYNPVFFVNIPKGSRIVCRGQSSITNATDRLFDVAAYGVS